MVLGNRETREIFFRGTGEQRPKNKGNTGNCVEQGTQKVKILFGGTREQGHFFEGNKGTGTPSPPREGFSCQPDIRSSSIPEKNP